MERVIRSCAGDLGERVVPAIIYPDYGHLDAAQHTSGRDHRSITAEHEYQIDASSEFFFADNLDRASGFILNSLSLDVRRADEGNAAFAQPLRQKAKCFEGVRLVRFDDDTNAFD